MTDSDIQSVWETFCIATLEYIQDQVRKKT